MTIKVDTGICMFCQKPGQVIMTEEQFARFNKKAPGTPMQDVLPDLSIADRELLISGTHSACFDLLLPEDDEDEA